MAIRFKSQVEIAAGSIGLEMFLNSLRKNLLNGRFLHS